MDASTLHDLFSFVFLFAVTLFELLFFFLSFYYGNWDFNFPKLNKNQEQITVKGRGFRTRL